MKYKTAQAIGLNTDQEAALALSSVKEEENIFLGVLQLVCDDAFTKGRQVLTELADFYLEESLTSEVLDNTPAKRLIATFKLAKEKLQDTENPHIILAAVSGKALYLIHQGEVEAFLKRSGNLSALIDHNQSEQLVSGFLQDLDKVLLSTKSLVSFLGDDLEKSLNLPVHEWEDDTASKVSIAGTGESGVAGLVLEVLPDEKDATLTDTALEENYFPKKTTDFLTPIIGSTLSFFSLLKSVDLFKFFPKSGRGRGILGVILVLVLITGTGIQYKRVKDAEKSRVFNQYIQEARDHFKAAQDLQTLSPGEAQGRLTAAKVSITKALELKPDEKEAVDLKTSIDTGSESILRQFSASNFSEFLDLNLVKEGFRAENISLSDNNLLLLDVSSGTLISIASAKKSQSILSGKDKLGDVLFSSLTGGFAFVYSKDKGIIKIDISSKDDSLVAKVDKELIGVADIAGFGSNVYVLDKANNQIWKYLATTTGYSDKREYLTKDTKADFGNAKRMQIESSIYVLKEGGEILRFTKGVADNFSLSGLDKGVKSPKSFFVSSETENLYILDSGNARLVVVDKIGVYKEQYQGDKFGSASDLVVDEKSKKVYLLEGSKIFSIDLK